MPVHRLNLIQYGVNEDQSDYRAHVCVNAGKVYVFSTRHAKMLLARSNNFRKTEVKVRNPSTGLLEVRAEGFLVPVKAIDHIVIGASDFIKQQHFELAKNTSALGQKAVNVVKALIGVGWFPFKAQAEEVEDLAGQYAGFDLIAKAEYKIQVKCDREGGEPVSKDPRVSGFLFFQTAERNPEKQT